MCIMITCSLIWLRRTRTMNPRRHDDRMCAWSAIPIPKFSWYQMPICAQKFLVFFTPSLVALRVPAGSNFMFWIWLVQYCNCPSVLKIFLPSHNFLLSFKLETDVLKTKIWWFIDYVSICCIIFASVTVYYHVLTTF